MNNPCKKDCPDRSPTCHIKGNCKHGYDEYAEYCERRRQARMSGRITNEYIAEAIHKNNRKGKRK